MEGGGADGVYDYIIKRKLDEPLYEVLKRRYLKLIVRRIDLPRNYMADTDKMDGGGDDGGGERAALREQRGQ